MSELLLLTEKLHRTWIEYLLKKDFNECAAIIVDAKLKLCEAQWEGIDSLYVFTHINSYDIIQSNEAIKNTLTDTFKFIAQGHVWNDMEKFPIDYRLDLLELEEDWQSVVKYLITNSKELNQGLITEKAFKKEGKTPIIYNEIKFASKSEVRIAEELEAAEVLFFPLPLAVRYETGDIYKDHREVDFLVCLEGTWGILEVSYHEGRYEKDKEKDFWFKRSGILCVEHYTAERCYNESKAVVNEFLSTLTKYKR